MSAVRAQRFAAFRPRARWILEAIVVLPRAGADLGVLAGALVRRVVFRRDVRGGVRAGPFRHRGEGGEGTPRPRITKLAGSFTPDTYPPDIARGSDVAVRHPPAPPP